MTWLGKILTFVVLVGSVVWAYFTVQAYVTRTNWQAAYTKLDTSYKALAAARETEARRYAASEEGYRQLLAGKDKTIGDQEKQITDYKNASTKVVGDVKTQQIALDKASGGAVQLQANIEALLKERDTTQKRNKELEDKQLAMILDTNKAREEAVLAQIEAKRAQNRVEELERRTEELLAENSDLRRSGGDPRRNLTEKPPPPVLPGLRGEVTSVTGDLLEVNICLEVVFVVGMVFDL
jgi:hypothetical protein